MVTRCWLHVVGYTLLVTRCWLHVDGYTFLKTDWFTHTIVLVIVRVNHKGYRSLYTVTFLK